MNVSDCTFLDDFRISGHWWLPREPEESIAGVLTFTPEAGIRLELAGLFVRSDFDALTLC
jgi:hypothetical protein